MGLGHAFEIDPDVENGFLYEPRSFMVRKMYWAFWMARNRSDRKGVWMASQQDAGLL